jgi:hypothetical protein
MPLRQVKSGSLLENFKPPVNPPKMIDDPEDKKPADWVDEAEYPSLSLLAVYLAI